MASGKVQILKKSIMVFKGIANLPCVANNLSNPQTVTHTAVDHGPILLCASGLAVLNSCTPLI